MIETGWVLATLRLANRILSSAILITAFSMCLYILRHNLRHAVGRAYCILLAMVMVVYLGDITILAVESPDSALPWLKFQWVGIAFVPAVYLHFSDALLNVTNSFSRWRRLAVHLCYLGGAVTLLLVVLTPWIVGEDVLATVVPHLQPGPFFWAFSVYFFAAVAGGAVNINQARGRCLTPSSRRRMGYLALSFAAPALGVFPYMLISALPETLGEEALLAILLLGNVGIALMIVVMTYTVAYFGAFNPDRVIKYGLIEYILRGPFLASLMVVILLVVPKVGTVLGLPGGMLTMFAAVLVIILVQSAISVSRPFLNRLVYRQDLAEVAWLQELDQRLLTPSDLEQFLENALISLAERLRVRHAFVITQGESGFEVRAHCGDPRTLHEFLERHNLNPLFQLYQSASAGNLGFSDIDGYVLRTLCTQNRDAVLGMLIIERWPRAPLVGEEVESDVSDLIEQAERALEDSRLQQGIFVALQQIMPDIDRLQKRRQLMQYVTSLPRLAGESPIQDPSFNRWVKDALSHYWGGPKLTQSPLLELEVVVSRAREQMGGDTVRALRDVLQQAIESLRPLGEQNMTAPEWTLYNILDLKFRQGWRMNDIAEHLAVSEPDLYRKQRAAIDEVSRALGDIERQVTVAP
jgi:hypothetical protein